ncbi:MAG TPA: hypothetical protein VFG54_18975 [Prolixibacteraceae bacterium]|nr:hypothetical protein [Prolixibacteraceae bacterium]
MSTNDSLELILNLFHPGKIVVQDQSVEKGLAVFFVHVELGSLIGCQEG